QRVCESVRKRVQRDHAPDQRRDCRTLRRILSEEADKELDPLDIVSVESLQGGDDFRISADLFEPGHARILHSFAVIVVGRQAVVAPLLQAGELDWPKKLGRIEQSEAPGLRLAGAIERNSQP